MTEQDVVIKLEYAIQVNSELSDLEFKTARSFVPNDIWRSISAFSHHKNGGVIVFGVVEKPVIKIDGCDNIDGMQMKLVEFFNDKMSFILRPKYYVFQFQGKTLLAVYIPECPKEYRPCYFKPVGLPNGAYIREGHTNRPLTDNEFRTYVASSKQFHYDLSEAVGVDLSDLSEKKINKLLDKREERLRRGASSKVKNELLQTMSVIGKFDDAFKPTLAGYLIFSKTKPQVKYPYERYTIRCVKYAGNSTSSDILDKADIQGTLDQQIDDTYGFILKNIRKTATIVGTKRIEKYEYPELAIRELVANAVTHRDYKILETYIHVNLFQDRLEISNPGSLPPGVTIDNLKEAQFSRNAVVAARLRDLEYLEEYGRGIDIVFDEMEKWNLQPPLFRNSVNTFQAILLGEKYKELNSRQSIIIDKLLLKGKLTIKDCVKILRETPRVTINNDLKTLKDLGLIERKGASVNTYYVLVL